MNILDILLVEDNKAISKGLEYSLSKNDYHCIVKHDVINATSFLRNNKVDLIILDISLPDGNGFDLYQSVISELEIPTIFLTAKDSEDDVVLG